MGKCVVINLMKCYVNVLFTLIIINNFIDVSPFDFFRQETSHPDVEIRTAAMSKVAIVAALMGPEKARTDMIAYLQSKYCYYY